MPIRFPCTACGQLLGIATRKVGTEISCPTCGLAVIVPDEEQAKLLRQQARSPKQSFSTPDTPPEISIPRERQEAFDGGLESFLTQLDVSPATSKATSIAPATNAKALPVQSTPPKSAPPIASAAPTVSSKPPAIVNASNGTHVAAPRPTPPTISAAPPPAKPQAAAAPPKLPPQTKPAQNIPLALALDDSEVSVLSAADLLELADEPLPAPTAPPSAKVAPPSAASPPLAKSPPAKPPATPPVTKQTPDPTPAKPTAKTAPLAPPPVSVPEIAPLVELATPHEPDFGFDFSATVVAPSPARKTQPAVTPLAPATQPIASIPAAPFENAVWISRRVIYTHVAILVLVSIVTFLIGWISGGAGSRLPVGSNTGPVRFEATIQYVAANGKTLPDDGAVVLLWPKQAKPLERLSSKRLSPSEPPPPSDLPTLKAIETLRGAYARTNAQGEIRDLLLAEPGEFYVLVISRNLARPPQEVISDKVLPILGDLFGAEALTLLGTRQFTLKSYTIAETRTLNHTFGAPAEK